MKPQELQEKHNALMKAAMQNAGVETAMKVFSAAQPAISTHNYVVYAGTTYSQSITTSSLHTQTNR